MLPVLLCCVQESRQSRSTDGESSCPNFSSQDPSGSGSPGLSNYDHLLPVTVLPDNDSPYASLGQIGSNDLISFAYQIASGMVQCVVSLSSLLFGGNSSLAVIEIVIGVSL